MPTIALIGPDGAGKTTIGHMLEQSSTLPVKYIYMGINIKASNYALLTSRLVDLLRTRRKCNYGRAPVKWKWNQSGKKGCLGAMLWTICRMTNRLADEWYRQLLSWGYQAIGYIVLYDRHFVFDFCLDGVDPDEQSLERRLHRWFLTHLYPRPDLVIYLDAPAEILFARKREKGIEDLERRRQSFIRQKRMMSNVVMIDATRPLLQVYADVTHCIVQLWNARQSKDSC